MYFPVYHMIWHERVEMLYEVILKQGYEILCEIQDGKEEN